MKRIMVVFSLAAGIVIGCKAQSPVDDKDAVLPGRHLSEHQVADIASHQLPDTHSFQCEFQDGVWEIREAQKGVWGISSAITNADGKVTITSTNATRVVLRVNDSDGKVTKVPAP